MGGKRVRLQVCADPGDMGGETEQERQRQEWLESEVKKIVDGGATAAGGGEVDARLRDAVGAKVKTLLAGVVDSNLPLVWRDLLAQIREGDGGEDDGRMVLKLGVTICRHEHGHAATVNAGICWMRSRKRTDVTEAVTVDLDQPELPLEGAKVCSCGHAAAAHDEGAGLCAECGCLRFTAVAESRYE